MNAKTLISLAGAAAVIAAAGIAWWLTSDKPDQDAQDPAEASTREARRGPSRKDRRPATPSDQDPSQAVGQPEEGDAPGGGSSDADPNPTTGGSNTEPDPTASPAQRVANAIALARRHFESGRISAAKTALANLRDHAPLSGFGAVQEELARDGAFPWRTLIVAELTAPADGAAVWALLEAASGRYLAAGSGKEWREGELDWLALLARRCAASDATEDQQRSLARILEGTTLAPVVEAVLGVLEAADAEKLKPWAATLRQVALKDVGGKESKRAGALLLKSTDEGGRAALFDDPALAPIRTELIRIALEQKLVPPGDLRSVVRQEIVAAATTGGRTGQSAARGLFDAFAKVDDAAALELSRELGPRQDLPGGLRTAALAVVAAHGSEQERAELVAAAKGVGAGSMYALDALVAAKVDAPWESVFRETQNPAAKALALEQLNAGSERMKWIGEALGTDMSRVLRVKATSLLNGRVENEQTRLRELAEQDRDPSVRKEALQRLGALQDRALAPFFRARAAGDEDPTLQALARDLAKALE